MSATTIESVVGKTQSTQIRQEIQDCIGSIQKIEQVSGGLVHYVYKITTDVQTAYLKIRADHYSQIPTIVTQPELIENEKRAIELFSRHSSLFFPEVILYNSALHYLLLSDVMPGGTTLDKRYQHGDVKPNDLYHFGRAMGTIHTHTTLGESVRIPNDTQYRANLMKYALESYEHPVLIQAAHEHKRRTTQLLVGDPSPKNIYIREDMVRLCDLENAHQGALPYDQAFILAHIVLHQGERDAAIAAMWAFVDGYEAGGGELDQQDDLVGSTFQGILLYRLANPVIPYELPYGKKQRQQLATNVFRSLDQHDHGLETIVANLFRHEERL